MRDHSLAQLMTWNIVTVDEAADLARAAEVMEMARISSVLVTALGKPVGIVTERDILRALDTRMAPECPVATVMGRPLVSALRDMPLHEAYHLMAERQVRHLLVTDGDGHPVGIVSESDFRFHLGLDFYRRLRDVRSVMNAQTPTLAPEATVRQAVEMMAARQVNCVVVAAGGKPVGIVTERDSVRFYREGEAALGHSLVEVMSSPVAAIPIGTHLHDAMELMQSRHVRHLVVVDEDGRIAGLLAEHDVVRQLEEEYLDFSLSESRRTRRQLRESELRRRAVFDNANEYMAILDPDGTLRDANRSALDLIDAWAEDVIGKPFWDTPWWCQDASLQSRLRVAFADLAAGRPSRFEATHPDAGGGLQHVDFQLKPILDESGKLTLALAEGSNITERKRAETELRQFQRAVEQSPVSIIITDIDARIEYVNPKFTEITGYSRAEVLGQNPRLLKSGLTPPATYDELWARLGRGESWSGELCNRRKDGSVFWEMARILPITAPDGKATHYLAVKEDITERRRVEEQRRLALSVFKSSHDGILITDANSTILDVNRAFCELTGYSREEAVGRPASLLDSGHHDQDFFRRVYATLAQRDYWQGEIWNRTKAGAISVVLMTISAVRDDAGRLSHYVGVFTDITQKKESERQLERLAYYDALTGLPNRCLFRDRLDQAIKLSRRDRQRLALLFIDLDRFKEVNDSLGHIVGDQLLVEAARRIASCLRNCDSVARLGGDEFTAVLSGIDAGAAVERVAGEVIAALAAPFELGTQAAQVSASVGIAFFPDDATESESLIRAADQAMYEAKAAGRNRYRLHAGQSAAAGGDALLPEK